MARSEDARDRRPNPSRPLASLTARRAPPHGAGSPRAPERTHLSIMHQASQIHPRVVPTHPDLLVVVALAQLSAQPESFAPINRRAQDCAATHTSHALHARIGFRPANGDSTSRFEGEDGSARASRGRSTAMLGGGDAPDRGGWGLPRVRARSAAPPARRVLVAVGTDAARPFQGD